MATAPPLERSDAQRRLGIPGPEPEELRLGDRLVRVEPFSGRKALKAFALLKSVGAGVPIILGELAAFKQQYEKDNSVVLSRTEALFEFPPHGDHPGRFDHLTEEDWAASNNEVRISKTPGREEQIAAVFSSAMDLAETQTLRLLALVAMSEPEVKERRGDLDAALDELAQELLDAPWDDLLELAVIGGEAINEQHRRKAEKLGARMGNALRLLGMRPTPKDPTPISSTEKPTSSTSSDASTAGDPTPPSAPTGDSSSDSTIAST